MLFVMRILLKEGFSSICIAKACGKANLAAHQFTQRYFGIFVRNSRTRWSGSSIKRDIHICL